jgi:hypothetical protein
VVKEVPILDNLLEYYRKADRATKKSILGCNSAKKSNFQNLKVATLSLKISVHLIL